MPQKFENIINKDIMFVQVGSILNQLQKFHFTHISKVVKTEIESEHVFASGACFEFVCIAGREMDLVSKQRPATIAKAGIQSSTCQLCWWESYRIIC